MLLEKSIRNNKIKFGSNIIYTQHLCQVPLHILIHSIPQQPVRQALFLFPFYG